MDQLFTATQFMTLFPTNEACLEEITRQRFPYGIFCESCKKTTRHYKVVNRPAFACKYCRKQVYPLVGTLFEKSSTPLRLWFLALFLMTQTRATISKKQLQRALETTYKTAWKMHTRIYALMEMEGGDLLKDPIQEAYKEHKWVFFKKLEIKVVQKQNDSEEKK